MSLKVEQNLARRGEGGLRLLPHHQLLHQPRLLPTTLPISSPTLLPRLEFFSIPMVSKNLVAVVTEV